MPNPKSLRFESRVRLISPAGNHIRTVHAEEAERLVHEGTAERCGNRRRAAEIQLVESLIARPVRSCSPPSVRQYMGQSYTFREAVGHDGAMGHVTQFKYINPEDRKIFILAITDCLSVRNAE
jgi:hypothetical protein